uniref:Uncharacterized protein n=1 Tax=mine drainage metagenome TaxID=410659 RepID=E6PJB7_9ZZZZ
MRRTAPRWREPSGSSPARPGRRPAWRGSRALGGRRQSEEGAVLRALEMRELGIPPARDAHGFFGFAIGGDGIEQHRPGDDLAASVNAPRLGGFSGVEFGDPGVELVALFLEGIECIVGHSVASLPPPPSP